MDYSRRSKGGGASYQEFAAFGFLPVLNAIDTMCTHCYQGNRLFAAHGTARHQGVGVTVV